jgi:hypothetical protein
LPKDHQGRAEPNNFRRSRAYTERCSFRLHGELSAFGCLPCKLGLTTPILPQSSSAVRLRKYVHPEDSVAKLSLQLTTGRRGRLETRMPGMRCMGAFVTAKDFVPVGSLDGRAKPRKRDAEFSRK